MHVIDSLRRRCFSRIIILLQPTCPLRTKDDIDTAINLFLKHKNKLDSVINVFEFDHSPYWSLKVQNGYITPNSGHEYFNINGQDIPSNCS